MAAQNGDLGRVITAIATFGLATNRPWTDERSDKQEEVEFHNITVFGKRAETANEYLRKGQLALIKGRLRTTSWETEDIKRYRTDIIAERIQFGPKRQDAPHADDDAEESDQLDGDDVVPF